MVDKQRILIVDDDENIAELISLYLMKECYETKIVGDGESALKEVPVFKPNLILLDLMLPGHGWLSGLPGDPHDLSGADHHAVRKGRGLRQSFRSGARCR